MTLQSMELTKEMSFLREWEDFKSCDGGEMIMYVLLIAICDSCLNIF